MSPTMSFVPTLATRTSLSPARTSTSAAPQMMT